MTKTNGLVLAAFLMASTSPMAFGQTTPPTPGGDTGTGAATTPGTDTGTGTTTTPGADAGTGTTTTPGADTSVGTGTGTGAATGTDLTTGAAMTDEDMERSMLITSLTMETGDRDWEEDFSNLSDDVEVKVVQLSELRDADTAGAGGLDQAIDNMEEGRSDLRAAVENHDRLMSALEDEDYSADDVVAAVIQPGADNEVTLIVDTENNDD
ncbi:MAG: hypothetical protein ACNA7O_00480 [Rhodobacterales bacterium]